jgi:protein-tyrosine phosphatase
MNRIFWVDLPRPGRLAIVARPRGGDWLEDDVGTLCAEGFSTIVSLIEKAEMEELDLAAFPEHCRSRGIDFHHLPIPDRGVPPSLPRAIEIARAVAQKLAGGGSIGIHCRAGIGRSGLFASAVLVMSGWRPAAAIAAVSAARGLEVPETQDQRAWVERLSRDAGKSALRSR